MIEGVGYGQDHSVVVVDYLQLLDQRRRNPELAVQVKTLAGFASTASTIIVAISQIDRSFDMEGKPLPNLSNVRLPNPVVLSLFTKLCFLTNGEMQVDVVKCDNKGQRPKPRSEEHTSALQSLMRISYA